MNSTFKRYLEIFIVIVVLFIIIYFTLYKIYFDSYCSKYSQEITDYKKMNLLTLANCKKSYICNTEKEIYELWKLLEYNCIKKKVDIFEYSYYENKLNKLIK